MSFAAAVARVHRLFSIENEIVIVNNAKALQFLA